MIVATVSSFLGSIWFATTLGLVGFVAGWYLCKKKCGRCS
jgi:hypothetical protein